jgi:hypothetical protein
MFVKCFFGRQGEGVMRIRERHAIVFLILTLLPDGSGNAASVPFAIHSPAPVRVQTKDIVPLAFRYRAQILARIAIPASDAKSITPHDSAPELGTPQRPVGHRPFILTGADLRHRIMSLQC